MTNIRGPKLCLLQAHRDDQSFLSQSTVVTIWSSQGPIHDTSCPKAVMEPLFFLPHFPFRERSPI